MEKKKTEKTEAEMKAQGIAKSWGHILHTAMAQGQSIS